MVRVRFHLGRGKHYRQWQIRHADGRVEYHDPDAVSLCMHGCRLRNQRGTARRIHGGDDKKVCAWVEADSVQVGRHITVGPGWRQITFNPRVAPHWRDERGGDIDGWQFAAVVSRGRNLVAGISV
jgi:hypothetical protein